MRFTDHTAVVTGGTRGIGLAIGRALASEGARVIAIGLEPMAEYLKTRRFPLEWNLENQIRRTAIFESEKIKNQ